MDSRDARQRRRFGGRQEQIAANYLQACGLRRVCSNYQCRLGEIDLIMRDGETLVFVEVRYRRQQRYGSAVASVGPAKQRRLWRCAQHYLLTRRLGNRQPCRFDVLGISARDEDRETTFHWIRDAFRL